MPVAGEVATYADVWEFSRPTRTDDRRHYLEVTVEGLVDNLGRLDGLGEKGVCSTYIPSERILSGATTTLGSVHQGICGAEVGPNGDRLMAISTLLGERPLSCPPELNWSECRCAEPDKRD